jgi:hypothetical protein
VILSHPARPTPSGGRRGAHGIDVAAAITAGVLRQPKMVGSTIARRATGLRMLTCST